MARRECRKKADLLQKHCLWFGAEQVKARAHINNLHPKLVSTQDTLWFRRVLCLWAMYATQPRRINYSNSVNIRFITKSYRFHLEALSTRHGSRLQCNPPHPSKFKKEDREG